MVIRKYKFFNKKFFAKTVTWKIIDAIVTFDKTSTDEKLLQEFEVETIKKGNL